MGAQALIDRGGTVGTEAAHGRIIPVEVRHRSFLSVARSIYVLGGVGVRPTAGWGESSDCPVRGEDALKVTMARRFDASRRPVITPS
jgi:hypothetical protein